MPAPRRIPAAEWEDHKDRIIQLYLDKRLTLSSRDGRDGVIETMEKEGFIATKSQYEAQFRSWEVRKNMKLDEWKKSISDIQQSRPIHLSGREVPRSRVSKARRRYGLGGKPTARRVTHIDNDIALEGEAHSVLTGVLEAGNTRPLESTDGTIDFPMHQRIDGYNINFLDSRIENVDANNPGFQGSGGEDLATGMYPLTIFSESILGVPGVDPILSPSSAILSRTTQLITHAPSPTMLPSLVGGLGVIFPRELWMGPLLSAQVIPITTSKAAASGTIGSTSISVSGVARFRLVTQFFSDVTEHLPPKSIQKSDPISSFPRALMCLASDETFVGEEQSQCQFTLLSSEDAFECRFYSRLIRSLMNGFAGLGRIPIAGIVKFLDRQPLAQSVFAQFLSSGPKCEAKALAESTFVAALKADNPKIVKLLLQSGLVDANDTIICILDERYSPLEIAAQSQSFEVIKILLDLKVDVNKYTQQRSGVDHWCKGPLDLLITRCDHHAIFERSFLCLVSNFLSAGALIEKELIRYVLDNVVDAHLIVLLLEAFIRQNPINIIKADFVPGTIKSLNENDATRLVKYAVEKCRELNAQKYLYRFRSRLTFALNEAIIRGYMELARLLLPISDPLDRPFQNAITCGNEEMIDAILKRNPNLETIYDGITPLSAALEAGNQKLILFLEENGVLDRLHGTSCSVAIAAALRVGNLAYATKVLDREADADSAELMHALTVALAQGYDAMAWRLLAAGAAVTPKELSVRQPPFPLYIAAKERKLQLVQAMLECDLYTECFGQVVYEEDNQEQHTQSVFEIVVDWGDLSILRTLLQKFPADGEYIRHSEGLRRILMKANQDLLWTIVKLSSNELRELSLEYALQAAIKLEDISLLDKLFDFGASPDDQNAFRAAANEHPSMVMPFLRRLREFYPRGYHNVAMEAVEETFGEHQRYVDLFDILYALELIDVDRLFRLECDYCIERPGQVDILKKLLDTGCNINQIWRSYHLPVLRTPLLAAITRGNFELVRLFVERGARVNEPTCQDLRRTPLQRAAEKDSLEIVRFLLEKGADINAAASGRHGGTALQFAAIVGNCTMATELIERGARFDVPPSWGKEGRWPLEGAAENGRVDMIQLLWYANRGDFDDRQCQKAMKLAEGNGHFGCRDRIDELMSAPRPANGNFLPANLWDDIYD